MFKAIREQVWYFSAFFKKYRLIMLSVVVGTIVLAFLAKTVSDFLPKEKPTYRIGIVGQYTSSSLPSVVTELINGGLTSSSPDLEPIPNLAEKWTIDDTGTIYTFTLKPGLKWSDGSNVLVDDIRIGIPGVQISTQKPDIIKFRLPSRFSPFPSLLNFPLVNQKGKIISKYDIKLKQKSSGVLTQIILESKQKKLIFNLYPSSNQAAIAYKLGQLDLISEIPTTDLKKNSLNFGTTKTQTKKNQVVMLMFNQADPLLKDKNTRQGIAYYLQDKTFGNEPAFTTVNPDSWGYNEIVKTYDYDPIKAKNLVKIPTNLELSTLPELLPIAEKIKNQLDQGIVKITIKVVTSIPDQYQIFLTTYQIGNDPDQYRDWHSTQSTNKAKVADEKLDKLLEDGRTKFDPKDRKIIYLDFQKTFAEELPAIVLYHPSVVSIAKTNQVFEAFR